MPSTNPHNHDLVWTDLLEDLGLSSATWWQIVISLYNKDHGYSNYNKCLKRGHEMVRGEVFDDRKVHQYLTASPENRKKVDAVLDEMCHLLNSQSNPSRKLKYAGVFFLKCITKVYSSIYVNNHLLPPKNGLVHEQDLFKKQFLTISEELPIVILPTHRSYMDFLFISYIMTHYELPLPIVATGDNFKALGKVVTDYLKSTGGFLLRRNAQRKKDIEAHVYHDILRAYVHSVLKGGEHPMEFFMEGTRTRVGQVLKPKTGLLSMVVDGMFDRVFDDVYILPVAINYQRPIEEQLFIAENTPQINRQKPKESAINLISAFDKIMKRQYGKVYVRFLEPFKLSEYFEEWKEVTKTVAVENGTRESVLFEFTNSLASKVCLTQANNNILMPFNLITCSLLSRTFLNNDSKALVQEGGLYKLALSNVMNDFQLLQDLLRATQKQFLPGWKSRLEVFDEFKLDRDNIVRATSDRRFVELDCDALTFQTLLYYSNQLFQVVLPVAICSLLLDESNKWDQYRSIRILLSREFFSNESFMEHEYQDALRALQGTSLSKGMMQLIVRHLEYFIECYLKFLNYLMDHKEDEFDKNEFFEAHEDEKRKLYISKDMLRNMTCLVQDEGICRQISSSERLQVISVDKLGELISEYEKVIRIIKNLMNTM